MRALAALLVALSTATFATALEPPTLIALADDGRLLEFRADRPGDVRAITTSGLGGTLLGVDARPADGKLYGLTDASDVYTIDPATGACTLVSTLTISFDGGQQSGVDFTPQADRLRIVSADGRNLRVNVTLGATAADGALAFAPNDPNAGRRPRLTAAGYTNNVAGAATTKLFEIDSDLDVLVLQDPPNDGTLTTVGPLGVDAPALAGFDIVTDADGADRGWGAWSSTLYTIDLATGRATPAGTIGAGDLRVIGLAAIPRRR